MSGSSELELTIVRADGVQHHIIHHYHLECTVDGESKKMSASKDIHNALSVKWNERLLFSINDTSRLSMRLYYDHYLHHNNEIGHFDEEVRNLQTNREIRLTLQSLDARHQSLDLICKLTITPLSEYARCAIDDTSSVWSSSASISRTNTSDSAKHMIQLGNQVTSLYGVWEPLLKNLKQVVRIVEIVAEIHPFAKAAWSIISVIPNSFINQVHRDNKISELIVIMNEHYAFIQKGELLMNVTGYKEQFSLMLKQTIECGHYIQAYARHGFASRAAKSACTSVDDVVDSFIKNFADIMKAFQGHSMLQTALTGYKILNIVENIGETVVLDDITYADGMRYDADRACRTFHTDILERIVSWANCSAQDDNDKRIFVLTGSSRSERSKVAHSVASLFDCLQRLASSFFFSKDKPEKSRPEMVLCTIARDIADTNVQVTHNLCGIVKKHRSLRKTTSISEQFERLVKEPTDNLVMVGPMVLVIDALDECDGDPEKRRQLMNILMEKAATLPMNFRIFITARSEDVDLERALKSAKQVRQFSLQEPDTN